MPIWRNRLTLPEGACLVGDDGHHAGTGSPSLSKPPSIRTTAMRWWTFFFAVGFEGKACVVRLKGRHVTCSLPFCARRYSRQRRSALLQVTYFLTVLRRTIEAQLRDVVVRQWQRRSRNALGASVTQLLGLVRGHARLAGTAHAVPLLGFARITVGRPLCALAATRTRHTACGSRDRRA